jgi:hemerythrin
MDRMHAELDELLLRALAPGHPQWAQLLGDVHAHLKEHFEAEDRWMRDSGFPPRECHMDEHAAVLRSSEEVLALAQRGEFGPAPSFVAELARWFPAHADHLDSALAAWMCKRQYGGKPIVVHRAQRHGNGEGGMEQEAQGTERNRR